MKTYGEIKWLTGVRVEFPTLRVRVGHNPELEPRLALGEKSVQMLASLKTDSLSLEPAITFRLQIGQAQQSTRQRQENRLRLISPEPNFRAR